MNSIDSSGASLLLFFFNIAGVSKEVPRWIVFYTGNLILFAELGNRVWNSYPQFIATSFSIAKLFSICKEEIYETIFLLILSVVSYWAKKAGVTLCRIPFY